MNIRCLGQRLGLRLLVLLSVLLAAQVALPGTVTYTYDDLGRLKIVTLAESQITYVLDAAGNRTSVTSIAIPGQPGAVVVPASSMTGNYTISWGASTGSFNRYELYEATSSNFSGQVQVYSGTALSSALSGKGNGTYYYRVRACDAVNCGNYSTAANAISITLPPGTPGSISVPPASPTGSYSITWGAASGNVTAYQLYEATNAGFSGQVLAYTGTALTKAIAGKGDGTFYYQVRACNGSACSGYRTAGNALVVAHPPGLPGIMVVPLGSTTGSYSISWGAASGTVTAYELYEALDPGFSSAALVYSGTGISNAFTGKSNGNYFYRVRACNGPSCSAYRTGANAVAVTLPPSVPGAVSVPDYNNTGSYTVSWGASTGNVTAYEVLESVAFGGEGPIYSGTATSIALTGKVDGSVYSYRLRACNGAAACSAYTSARGQAGSVFVDKTAPTAPAQLFANGSPMFSFYWTGGSTDTGGSGVPGWYVYRDGVNLATVLYPMHGYTDQSAPANVTLNYTVRAFDRAGNVSGPSNTVSLYHDTIPPTTPTGLQATLVTMNQVSLAWIASTDANGVSYYDISRSLGGGGLSHTTTFDDLTVASNTTYTYQVVAYDHFGGPPSAPATLTVTTPPGAPSVPTMNTGPLRNTTGNFLVRWDASTGAVASYILEEDVNGSGFHPYPVAAPATSMQFSGKNSGDYNYRVKACTSGGACSGYSATRFLLVCIGSCQ